MAAAAAAARSMPISDVLRLRVHVLNAPGAGGGDAVRSGGRQQSAVVQLLTTMSPQSDIYHLKVSAETSKRRKGRARRLVRRTRLHRFLGSTWRIWCLSLSIYLSVCLSVCLSISAAAAAATEKGGALCRFRLCFCWIYPLPPFPPFRHGDQLTLFYFQPLPSPQTRVEHQFASLFPSAPPLVVRAVQDQDNFLLPDELVVGAVLTQNDPVNIIAEGGVFQGSEPEAVAEQRWDASRIVTQCLHWTEHSSMFFGANPFGSPPAVEVTNEVVLMLCDLCVSAREKTRDMACLGLGKFGAYLRSGLQIKDASIRNVCAAARRSTVRRTSEALAIFLQRLAQLDDGRHAAAMARTGGREAAMSLASGKDSSGPTQTAAMEVLMVLDKLTHGEEHVNRQRPAVNPEPRYLAERKHKARLEKAALEQASGGRLAASQVGKNAQPNSKPVTFTFEGGSGAGANVDQVSDRLKVRRLRGTVWFWSGCYSGKNFPLGFAVLTFVLPFPPQTHAPHRNQHLFSRLWRRCSHQRLPTHRST